MAIFFLLALGTSILLGELTYRHFRPFAAWRGSVPSKDSSWIISETNADQLDIYETLFYGLGSVLPNLQRAEVLFLGDSRVLFAFRDSSIRPYSDSTGIRFFNLSFPAGDGMRMALDTIRRLDLSPRIVVVNEEGFFNENYSPYAEATQKEGRWRALGLVAEHRISWAVRSHLHRWLPRFSFGNNYSPEPYALFQCPDNGCLAAENFPSIRIPFHPAKRANPVEMPAETLQLAEEFLAEMKKRGTQVVLTDIPYGVDSIPEARRMAAGVYRRFMVPDDLKRFHRAFDLAKALGIPLISPPLGVIETYDGIHLTKESGECFADSFLKEFSHLSSVEKLSSRTEPKGR